MTTAVQLAQSVAPGVSLGFKNRILNGAMTIDQRNAGASVSVSTSGIYVLDRWANRANGGGVFSVQQSSTAPAGFTNSTVYTVTTPDSSIAAGDNYWILQNIEGYNVADLGWGTANAQTIAVSFWVRSSVAGTYSVCVSNGSVYDRSYVSTYTISSANTYEYKTITIPGDTSGTWGKTNSGGIALVFNLGAGATYQTTAGSWQSGFLQGTSATTQWIATNGATFYITGVQLEVGTAATNFEFRDYGRELIMCQRYYSKSYAVGTAPGTATQAGMVLAGTQFASGVGGAFGVITYPVQMRSAPSVSVWDGAGTANANSFTYGGAGSGQSIGNNGAFWGGISNISATTFFAGATSAQPNALAYIHYAASAEL